VVSTDPSVLAAEQLAHPLVERRVRARSQESVHDRARAVAAEMEADGFVLIAQSWRSSARGGTATLVFSQRAADEAVTRPREPIHAGSRANGDRRQLDQQRMRESVPAQPRVRSSSKGSEDILLEEPTRAAT